MSAEWPVVPISSGQLLDVDPFDLLDHGIFRRCDVSKSGGGYDKFPEIALRYFGCAHHMQFIVQLFGCTNDCPYCYVTREGVWGYSMGFSTEALVEEFQFSECSVFHLMGGAPAIYMDDWPELIEGLALTRADGRLFHSDLLLTEHVYDEGLLRELAGNIRTIYAVNIKGVTPEEYAANTRRGFDEGLMWDNLEKVEYSGLPYYLTFTNIPLQSREKFWNRYVERFGAVNALERQRDSFTINLVDYEALKHVDDVPWGIS